ncbi:plastocyanin/azurin family copper-binding protein [Cohnella suwonensis]|uniref:Plastocyanin/azurin family copper-binding protein n=1 Tax=Cohnella suwonensis TaxID=696072 RepID=A0ABW0LRG7_9BACL
MAVFAEGEQTAAVSGTAEVKTSTSSDIAAQLGVLKGDGQGVTDEYLAKTSTRLQAAILLLRLMGKEQEALSYTGTATFADANSAGKSSRPVLAYLKNHPEYGWTGTSGGKFEPNATITAQQLYKVMLESLRFRSGTDFTYKEALAFAESKGLFRAAKAVPFTNRDLAAALTETLQAMTKDGKGTLLQEMIEMKIVSADKAALLNGQRIDIRKTADGTYYLTDGKGMALYLFTKDMADLNSCQGQCLANWPVFAADRLILPEGLDSGDFGAFVRTDGSKQLTYKGWPLYYFVMDAKAGDVNGEGANSVWFLIKQPFYTVGLGTDAKLGNYLVDSEGKTLYYFDKDPAGASVCSGDCLKAWPAFHENGIVAPKGLNAADFGEITRNDGTKQTTFKGYPLYYFVQDAKRGDLKGQGLNNVWYVVDPAKFTGTTAGKAAPASVPAKVTIEMKGYKFATPEVTVKAGTTIEFVNMDPDQHNAVAVDGSFKTKLLDKGESATITLDKPGVYEYYCAPHAAHMKGKIIVQ